MVDATSYPIMSDDSNEEVDFIDIHSITKANYEATLKKC